MCVCVCVVHSWPQHCTTPISLLSLLQYYFVSLSFILFDSSSTLFSLLSIPVLFYCSFLLFSALLVSYHIQYVTMFLNHPFVVEKKGQLKCTISHLFHLVPFSMLTFHIWYALYPNLLYFFVSYFMIIISYFTAHPYYCRCHNYLLISGNVTHTSSATMEAHRREQLYMYKLAVAIKFNACGQFLLIKLFSSCCSCVPFGHM